MKMHGIEAANHVNASRLEIGRPIEPPEPTRSTIIHLHSVDIDCPIMRNITIARPIHTGRENVDDMTSRHETST
jgi:hypothetical protein